ncbi:uncharacterized protein AB675_48 [Cyphellophora attinorum]|uniref:FAD-binding domain-containing protein n=1 Tax=Cyphellophora attinorum TaxID=1664694 RepID=A0A0N1NV99_9EURO|nr:uncharacterized protein AB675_48 [Phialophora attinorum]KPI34665.1 hypothetical protein AB675_48 [Phialophora attinorum]
MEKFNVIIAGGGLAGPLLANGLLEAGVQVDVYEKLKANAKRDGYSIRVAQPCLTAFRKFLSEDQCATIVSKLGSFEGGKETTPIWYDHNMKPLIDMQRVTAQYDGSAPMDRVVLRDILMERPLSEGIVHFDKSFSRYEIISKDSRESVRVFFEDGTSADCDVLIAADGSHSKVNQQIGLDNIVQVPVINFITKVKLSRAKYDLLPAAARRRPIICFSHKMTYFCVAYTPKSKSGTDASSGKSTNTKIDIDETAATFTFSLLMLKSECPEDIKEWTLEKKWSFLSEAISTWDNTFLQVIDVLKDVELYIFEPRASKRPAMDWRSSAKSASVPTAGHPRVWLLGDAMHVMLPNRGMGGNQAMLDTTFIAPLLKRLNKSAEARGHVSTAEVAAACQEYEREMIPRAFEWVELSGGTKAVPFDTNTYIGQLTCLMFRLSLDVRDRWNAVCRAIGMQ